MNSCVKKILSEKVESNFSLAAFSYERAAHVQKAAASKLVDFISQLHQHRFHPRLIMELGAGTGFVTRKIIPCFCGAKFLVTDISDEMLDICRRNVFSMTGKKEEWMIEFELLDFNSDFEIPSDCNMLISGFSFQWAEDMGNLIKRVFRQLPNGAFLAFSVLCDGSLKELRDLFEKVGADYPVPPHPTACEIRKYCEDFSIFQSEEYHTTSSHSSLCAFLQSLRNVGAVNPGFAKIQPGKMKQIISGAPNGEFKVRYEIMNVLCQKK